MESPCESDIKHPCFISHGVLLVKPIGRSRRRWKENIRMYFKEIGVNTRNLVDSVPFRDY